MFEYNAQARFAKSLPSLAVATLECQVLTIDMKRAVFWCADDVDEALLWNNLLVACNQGPQRGSTGAEGASTSTDVDMVPSSLPSGGDMHMHMQTVSVQGRPRLRLTLLPPPRSREDLLAVTEVGRSAEVVLVAIPGAEGLSPCDSEGERAMGVLRSLGLPHVVGVVQGAAGAAMKDRSAAKKRADKYLSAQVRRRMAERRGYLVRWGGSGCAASQEVTKQC